ncbi:MULTISPECIES: hypothetical protein [unclassified Mucilaginibacter]|uniref:hypothetical protein n=1 Tax=unclassified Mucilaginibacter TaxID=2617802 RepID=UPI00096835B8|nr:MULTISPECIES: hypothetical protein [unclassified Mucilaginibacter]OJW16420.1 MAG: hypothetical protein BGO48_09580 [Mucilaginibacter sp. 44-25]PLW91008.1 MAG: hypothetical protein C0154_03440 [Mucilaginibacter sp.]HEK21683.1 hypothetical protein [Bacteroidota bacterium]
MSVTYKNALPLIITAVLAFAACKYRDSGPGHGEKPKISFKSVEGINFIEVSRRQKNGLSFNEYGYHLTPDWRLRFVSADSAALYSPQKDAFFNFPLALGTDSVFNIAHAFLKMKNMSKDSLTFELLEAQGDSIDIHKSRVVMKLYSEPYIKKTGKDLKQLQAASRKDTLFVRGLVAKANADIKKAFAAANPVQLISKNPNLQVTKRKTKPSLLDNKYATDDDYLTPTYDIVIHKAYQDFNYSFEATVDSAGVWHYNRPLVPFLGDEDVKANYIKVSTGIMNTYLKLFMNTLPGETLGMKHSSTISVNVKGITAAK